MSAFQNCFFDDTMENIMKVDLTAIAESCKYRPHAAICLHRELELQRLRILRCTAQAMASGPGGLRFRAGSRPWLPTA